MQQHLFPTLSGLGTCLVHKVKEMSKTGADGIELGDQMAQSQGEGTKATA